MTENGTLYLCGTAACPHITKYVLYQLKNNTIIYKCVAVYTNSFFTNELANLLCMQLRRCKQTTGIHAPADIAVYPL